MSEYGRVFDQGLENGTYSAAQELGICLFYSSEDDAWFALLKRSPGLSVFGETPVDALREFCVMLPAALASGLSVEDVSEPISTPKQSLS